MRLSVVLILAAVATAVLCHSADSGSHGHQHHGHKHGHGHHSHHGHHGHHGHGHGHGHRHGHKHGHHHNKGHDGHHHPSHHSSKKHHKTAVPHIHYFQDNLNLDKVSASQLKDSFKEWKKVFGKKYASTSEEAAHYQTYLSNWRMIITHNKATNESFKMEMNQFADLTQQQFVQYIGSCFKGGAPRKLWKEKIRAAVDKLTPHLKANPASIDWTTKGVVTPVKNQGQCGSCWAFSTTGSLECRAAIKTGKLVSLSEQQLVDCSRAEGNMGCNGGLMDDAFKYIKKEGGLCSESEYPYKASDGVCKASSCGTKYDAITGYTDVPKDSAPDLETAAAQGCVSVAIEADQSAFQFYKSGILTGRCGTRLDHGVLVVGYGEEGGKKYWKVKNSWGRTWGEEGYVRICKECGKDLGKGECGILEQPSYPTV